MTSESLWNYYRDEMNDDMNENTDAGNYTIATLPESVHIWGFSGLHFTVFALKTKRYRVNIRI